MVSQFTIQKGAGRRKSGIHTFGGDATPESDKVKQLKEALSVAISDKDDKIKELESKIKELEKESTGKIAELTKQLDTPRPAAEIDPAEVERVAGLEKEVKVLKTQNTKANNKLKDAAQMLRESDVKQKELQTQIDNLTKEPNVT